MPGLRPRRLLRLVAERHATRHFRATNHPVMRSREPGEDWGSCYVDEVELGPEDLAPRAD